jgi:flagellar biosynthesis/type III secretory pathway protein FliH
MIIKVLYFNYHLCFVEIHPAQGIIDKVDQQQADAEDEARRGREKVRNLTEERVVALAMEEGRRMGYEEGMRQSRLMMQARDNDEPSHYYRRTSFRSTRDDNDNEVSYFSYRQEERHSTESSRSPTNPSTSVR